MKKLFFVSIFTLLLISVNSTTNAQWITTQLTSNTTPDSYPQTVVKSFGMVLADLTVVQIVKSFIMMEALSHS